MVTDAAAEPHLELGDDHEQGRERPVKRQRVGPEAAQTTKNGAHGVNLDRLQRSVIGRSADPQAPKDQPTG